MAGLLETFFFVFTAEASGGSKCRAAARKEGTDLEKVLDALDDRAERVG